MRISTAQITQQAILEIDNQESALSTTQNQVSTGVKVATAADDPVAAVQIVQLNYQQAQITQYGTNATSAQTRLTLDQTTLSSATDQLQSIRDLAVEAGDASLNDSGRQALVTQLQTQIQSLMSLANTKDSNGEYLYSGYDTQTQPFVTNSSGNVSYQGNSGTRLIQIGQNQSVADSDTGNDVFMDVPSGNGTFATSANSANSGSGTIDSGSVTNSQQWVPDTYTISFTGANTYQVTNSASTVVASGTYTSGGEIAFDGVQVSVSGTPASGDSFTVSPSSNQSIFSTLQQLVTTLSAPADNSTARATLASNLGSALTNIDQGINHLDTVAASVGGRLNQITTNTSSLTATSTAVKTQVSSLQDVDYASAVATLNTQYVGLQAAEQSYAAVAQLSLFKYLS